MIPSTDTNTHDSTLAPWGSTSEGLAMHSSTAAADAEAYRGLANASKPEMTSNSSASIPLWRRR